MKKNTKQMAKNQNRRGTPNTGMQMNEDAKDVSIDADFEILHPRGFHSSYYPKLWSTMHPQRETPATTMKPTPKKVRKAAKKVPTKKRK